MDATGHAYGLAMPMASGRLTLFHLTHVLFPSRAPVAHSSRRDGTERHDQLMTPVCGTSGKWGHNVEPSPSSSTPRHGAVPIVIYRTGGTWQGGEGRCDPGSPFPPRSLSHVTCTFPLAYKRGGRTPHRGGRNPIQLNPTQLHSTLPSKTWDLLPLSSVCNPYYKLVLVT
jgi:hypothetical protein